MMHEHGPDSLIGPVRGTATWWKGMGAEAKLEYEGTPDHPQPRKKGKDEPPMRMDLVTRIRKEIAAGTYDTPEKWEAALDCLLGQLDANDP